MTASHYYGVANEDITLSGIAGTSISGGVIAAIGVTPATSGNIGIEIPVGAKVNKLTAQTNEYSTTPSASYVLRNIYFTYTLSNGT